MIRTQNTASTIENSGSALAVCGTPHQSNDNRHKKEDHGVNIVKSLDIPRKLVGRYMENLQIGNQTDATMEVKVTQLLVVKPTTQPKLVHSTKSK